MEVTIARHCVPLGPDGLSPLQRALGEDPRPVRVAAAPTGAGKTHAFVHLVAARDRRVLFFVPTRRLAANLAFGLHRDLTSGRGWSEAKAAAKVAEWSGSATQRLRLAGVADVTSLRLRQVDALSGGHAGGEMVIAVPKSVVHLLLRRALRPGLPDVGILHILDAFDHIVFDEFHTIDPRGFGLAATFAGLAAADPSLRAKVSFLSATPLDLLPTLTGLGVAPEKAAILAEEVVGDGRAIHGDVTLELVGAETLTDLVIARMAEIAAEIRAGRQVVVVYDRHRDLLAGRRRLEEAVRRAGLAPEDAGLQLPTSFPVRSVLCWLPSEVCPSVLSRLKPSTSSDLAGLKHGSKP